MGKRFQAIGFELTSLALIGVAFCCAQKQISSLYTTNADKGESIIFTHENNYAVAGTSFFQPSCGVCNKWFFRRIAPNGNSLQATDLWIGIPYSAECRSLIETSDNTFALAGNMSKGYGFPSAATVMILNQEGDLVQAKSIESGLMKFSEYHQVISIPDGIVCAGSFGISNPKVLVACYSNDLTTLKWAYKYNTSIGTNETAYSLCFQPSDKTYGVVATSENPLSGGKKVEFLKLKLDGSVVSCFSYEFRGGIVNPHANAQKIVAMHDGGFAITGFTDLFTGNHVFLLRLRKNGIVQYLKVYGKNTRIEKAFSMTTTDDRTNLLITGQILDKSDDYLFYAKFKDTAPTTDGIIWKRRWNMNHDPVMSEGYDVVEARSTPEYAITGVLIGNTSIYRVLFLRCDHNGDVVLNTGVCPRDFDLGFHLSPNPSMQELSVKQDSLTDSEFSPSVNHPSVSTDVYCH